MSESILVGRGKQIVAVPRSVWEAHLTQVPEHGRERLSFMSKEHHRLRYFVVRELPRYGRPLAPEVIAQELNLPVGRVNTILHDLEKHLTFLVRNKAGAVAWAYPVTVERTPHVLTFNSGERSYAA